MPVRTARSGIGLRPADRRFRGGRGSIRAQKASSRNGLVSTSPNFATCFKFRSPSNSGRRTTGRQSTHLTLYRKALMKLSPQLSLS